jgi:hypothetical protein
MITQGCRLFKEVPAEGEVTPVSEEKLQWRGGPFGRPSSLIVLYCTVTGILSVWVTVAPLMLLVPVTVTV